MTTPPNTKIETLFFASRERPPADRMAYLEAACGGDQRLFEAVRNLLIAGEGEDSMLDKGVELQETAASVTPAAGKMVGRYKLLQRLGEGGFGVVFMAEQTEPISRHVAVKIIKPGMDSKAVIARFEAERQALAMMDHPNIAKVLDGGTTDGRPFFVMELVRGVAITEFCDKRRLSSKERLQLFVDVCNAVQHAHQKGIIHRDLKPSNVMITLHDGKPVVKVIDFGVARAIHQKLTDKTLFTHYGQMIGTPQYMSPEQAEMSGLDVDTRSDIYSLGVLLYELLTGTPPLRTEDFQEAGYAEIQRMICEKDLVKPSERLSTTEGQQLTKLAEFRGIAPGDFRRQFQGELDWVVMKTLEKDRDRRYATANDLAEDVNRYLNDEVVVARPPSIGYRVTKYIRRHRVAVTTSILLILALASATAVSSRYAYLATEANKTAVGEREAKEAARAEEEKQRIVATDRAKKLEWQLYVSKLSAAQQAIDVPDVQLAIQRLDECPKVHRDWEWDRLSSMLANIRWHGDLPVQHVPCFLNDARFTIVGDGDKSHTLQTWDASTKQLLREIPAGKKPIMMNALHPDGKTMVVGTQDGVITLVDLETGRPLLVIDRAETSHGHIDGFSFSNDGSQFASVCWDGVLNVWDTTTGQQLYREQDLGRLSYVKFDPTGRYLAAGGTNDTAPLRIWNANSFELIDEFKEPRHKAYAISFSPDGKRLACGHSDGRITVRETGDFRKILLYLVHGDDIIRGIKFSSDGKWLAAAGYKSTGLFDAATGKRNRKLPTPHVISHHIAFSRDNRFLVSTGMRKGNTGNTWDGVVLDLQTSSLQTYGDQHLTLFSDDKGIATRFSPCGRMVAIAGRRKAVDIFDVHSSRLLASLQGYTNPITSLAWSRDGQSVFIHERVGRIHSHRLEDRNPVWTQTLPTSNYTLHGSAYYYGEMALDDSGKKLFVGLANGDLVALNADSGEEVERRQGHSGQVNWLAMSGDRSKFATAGTDGKIGIWDVKSFRKTHSLDGHKKPVRCVAFSPDGTRLASTAMDGTRIWDTASGNQMHQSEHRGWSCVFSKNGKRLLSPAYAIDFAVLDVETGTDMLRFDQWNITPTMSLRFDGSAVSVVGTESRIYSSESPTPEEYRIRQLHQQARGIFATLLQRAHRRADMQKLLEEEYADLDQALQQVVGELIEIVGGDPHTLFWENWDDLLDQTQDDFSRLAGEAETAWHLVPDSGLYALGAALGHLRTERYQDSIDVLESAMSSAILDVWSENGPEPIDLRPGFHAVLAMAQHYLGNDSAARASFEKISGILPQDARSMRIDRLLKEASEVVNRTKAAN